MRASTDARGDIVAARDGTASDAGASKGLALADTGVVTIGEALEKWATRMKAEGARPGTVRQFRASVAACAEACSWRSVLDVRLDDVEAYIAERRENREWSGTTADGKASVMKCFGAFLAIQGWVPTNPLENVPKCGDQGEEGARPLRLEEATVIVEEFCRRAMVDRRASWSSAVQTVLLFKTGWRPFMLAGIRACDLQLDAAVPHYVTDPSWTKNRRRMKIALDAEAVMLLRWLLAVHGAEGERPVVPELANRNTWKAYVSAAGVEYGSKRSGLASMYATRKTFATWLDESSASAGVREWLLAHWDPYTKPSLESQREALARLPSLWPEFARKNLENAARSAKRLPGGSDSSVEHSYNTKTREPRATDGTARTFDARGSHFEAGSEASTTHFRSGNGHSRIENAGKRSVLDAVLGLIEAQGALLRVVVEVLGPAEGRLDGGESGQRGTGGGEGV